MECITTEWSWSWRYEFIHGVSKRCHFYFCNNFGNCRPVLIILSLLYFQIYYWGRWY